MSSELEKQIQAGEEEWKAGWKRGPQRLRWTELPPQVGDQAKDFTLLDSSGESVKLSAYWRDKPALIIFWRHYGCGCGIDRTAAYAQKYNLPSVPVLCDPNYEVYQAYGLVEGKTSQILFDAPDEYLDLDFEAGMKLAAERSADDRPLVDNSWLLPGEFVVDQSGEIRLTYRYNYCEDFPDHRVLLAAIRESNQAVSSG